MKKTKKNWGFWPKFWSLKFSLLPQKTAENGQTSESREKVKNNNIAWDVANNRYVDRFFQKNINKSKQNENQKTHIGKKVSPTYCR